NSINDVEKIKGKDIKIQRESVAESLDDDEFLISDLIGLQVFNRDEELIGTIREVGTNGASEILEVSDANNKVHLIPFVKALVPFVDVKNKTIVINDIEGLIE
ncbi:MAG: ribosome maturation factor RimM, partial [Candidatus Gastranaerophilaceae bacterium]